MLESVGSDLEHVVHVNIFLAEMSDFEAMNAAYVEKMGPIGRREPYYVLFEDFTHVKI